MKTISTFHKESDSDVLLEQAFNQFRSQFLQIITQEKQNYKQPQIETINIMELKIKIDKYKNTCHRFL